MRKIIIIYGFILSIVIFAYEMTPRTDVLKNSEVRKNLLPQKEITKKIQPQQSRSIWDNVIFRIDDGPDKYTSELVKTLKELGIKHAIFGLIGRNVLQYPDAVQEIIDAGYIVANHTFTHPRMHLRWVRAYYAKNPDKWRWQINKTTEVINQALKSRGKSYQCKIFCFPEIPKCFSASLVRVVEEQGLEPNKAWDIDSRDSICGRKRLTLDQLVTQITHLQNKKDTVEVLIHSRKGGWSDKIREIDKVLTSLKGNNSELPTTNEG
jgi:hypothetical protein